MRDHFRHFVGPINQENVIVGDCKELLSIVGKWALGPFRKLEPKAIGFLEIILNDSGLLNFGPVDQIEAYLVLL